MRYHLVHILVPRGHGLMGYKEVIDSVHWGLTQLGHTVTYGVNEVNADACNIIFGAQMLSAEVQATFPANSIVYNFEQIRGRGPTGVRRTLRAAAERFRIWDYSAGNLDTWRELPRKFEPVHVPVGYAPNLTRIGKAPVQDIDVLFYGMPNELRLSAFHAVAQMGLTAVFLCGLYGEARDQLIARAKTVLNVTLYREARVFEIVRVSYLWANRKAVIANIDPDTDLEPGVLDAVVATSPETLKQLTNQLVMDDARRAEVEERGFSFFSQRRIEPILEAALDASR